MQKAIEESKKTAKKESKIRKMSNAAANQRANQDSDEFDTGFVFDKYAAEDNSGFDKNN